MNYIESKFQEQPWIKRDNNYQVMIKNCMPRPNNHFVQEKEERPKSAWSIDVSLFKGYKTETEDLVNQCFDYDWKCMKKPAFKNTDADVMKEKMKRMYPFMRQVYKRLSALGISGIIFAVGWNEFREFITRTLDMDDKQNFSREAVDLIFK